MLDLDFLGYKLIQLFLLSQNYQIVILYGELMKNLHTKLLQQNADLVVYHVEKGNEELIIDYLHDLVKPEDILVLKGSNSMGLVKIVEKISSK